MEIRADHDRDSGIIGKENRSVSAGQFRDPVKGWNGMEKFEGRSSGMGK